MSVPENEVAAANQQRRMEEISISPVGAKLGENLPLLTSVLAATKALTSHGEVSAIAVAGGIVGTLGIVDWFKKLGTSKVNENLEVLGQATEDALIRVEQALSLHGTSIDEIKARIESQNFKDGMASAALQALRTTQKERLKRMAQILANGVQDGDLESEGLDDMMRAAVELKESDILLLNKIYESQNPMFGWSNLNPQTWHSGIQDVWRKFVDSHKLDSLLHLSYRSSLSRLQSAGMIQKIEVGHFGVGHEPYALLKEGKKFRERLQQITTEDKK